MGHLLTSSTGGTLNVNSSLAVIKISPHSTKPLLFDIPMTATGGQVTSIANEITLRSYLRSLLSYKSYETTIFNQLQDIQSDLAGIWQSKADIYFHKLQITYDFVEDGLNPFDYAEAVSKVNAIKYSYININSFIDALLSDFQNDFSKTGLLSLIHI